MCNTRLLYTLYLVVRTTFDMSNGLLAGFVIGGVLYGTLLYLSSANVVYSGAWDFTIHHNVKVTSAQVVGKKERKDS